VFRCQRIFAGRCGRLGIFEVIEIFGIIDRLT